MSERLGRIIADWIVIVSAAVALALLWLGPPSPRFIQTVWLVAIIGGFFQLQCYRRWLSRALRWLDEAHEREAWYRDRCRW